MLIYHAFDLNFILKYLLDKIINTPGKLYDLTSSQLDEIFKYREHTCTYEPFVPHH